MNTNAAIDRLSIRKKPEGIPVMEQTWEKLLFIHRPIPEVFLRKRIPPDLEIDTFEGTAWLGITPFRLTNLRLLSLPPMPGISTFNEINLRTYVHYHGTPGVYFFSLDASELLPAVGARAFYTLPYFKSDIQFTDCNGDINCSMTRERGPKAAFNARWRAGASLPPSEPDSLEFFLVERYCFMTEQSGSVQITRIHHAPWQLREADLFDWKSSLASAAGIPEPSSQPLLHYSETLTVNLWTPHRLP